MAMAVICPGCGKSLFVDDSKAVREARCDQCGVSFTVPVSLDGTARPVPDPDLAERTEGPAEQETQASPAPFDGPDQAEEPPPKTVGHYVLVRKLGAGNMGVVWLAHDPNLDRNVAIKVLPAAFATDAGYLKRFLSEARLAAKLHHPNTVTVHDAGEDAELAYMVMEFVEGGSLDKAVAPNRPMDWREATQAIRDAATGLAAAHEIGLIHRDVKPENLMRTTKGVTKVVDFGLARSQLAQTRYTQQGMLLGTPVYLAPEVWMGQEADARSDLYSLILSYYYLLAARVPFDGATFEALGYQHHHEPLPDPRKGNIELPDAVCRILLRGSAKESAARYSSAAELAAELNALLAVPQRSLAFGASWEKLVRSASMKSAPAKGEQSPLRCAAAAGGRLGRRWRKTLALGAAGFGFLAVILYVATNHGLVKIELADPTAKVAIKVDGDAIEITGLREPLRLWAGPHELEVTSGGFQTFTKSFTVKRGETEVVRVALEPRPKPALPTATASAERPNAIPKTDAPIVVPATKPATYRITIHPADARLTASGKGITLSGEGAERTITVAEPDGQAKVLLVAMKPGFKTLEKEIEPRPGEVRSLALELERVPEPKPAPVEPPSGPPRETINSIGMKLVLIPAGEFMMGSSESTEESMKAYEAYKTWELTAEWFKSEHPQHQVRITKAYYLGTYEVTRGQFRQFVEATGYKTMAEKDVEGGRGLDEKGEGIQKPEYSWRNPGFPQTDEHPVVNVSWNDAAAFCEWLSRKEGKTYRLPTEAEWEYACRAGTATRYQNGDDPEALPKVGNVRDAAAKEKFPDWTGTIHASDGYVFTAPVGQFRPNAFGLYDMHGNAEEWCADALGDYIASPADDPRGPNSGILTALRGGSWYGGPLAGRSAARNGNGPAYRDYDIGFRVARTN